MSDEQKPDPVSRPRREIVCLYGPPDDGSTEPPEERWMTVEPKEATEPKPTLDELPSRG